VIVLRAPKMPVYDARRDGNVFDFVLWACEKYRKHTAAKPAPKRKERKL